MATPIQWKKSTGLSLSEIAVMQGLPVKRGKMRVKRQLAAFAKPAGMRDSEKHEWVRISGGAITLLESIAAAKSKRRKP